MFIEKSEKTEKTEVLGETDPFPVPPPPSYESSTQPLPESLGVFPHWAQHHDEQHIKLHARLGFSSKVFATDEATGITILQWKGLTNVCSRGVIPAVFLVENARTNEPLLKVCEVGGSLDGYAGNWIVRHPHTNQIVWEISRPPISGGSRNLSVRFRNTAAGPGQASHNLTLHRHFWNPRWELQMPNGSIRGTVQEPIWTYRPIVTS